MEVYKCETGQNFISKDGPWFAVLICCNKLRLIPIPTWLTKHCMTLSKIMDVRLGVQSIIRPTGKLSTPVFGTMSSSCVGMLTAQRWKQFAEASTEREKFYKKKIISANMRIKSGSLMTRTDRTNDGHVRHVPRYT